MEDIHVVWQLVRLGQILTWVKLLDFQLFWIGHVRDGDGSSVCVGSAVVRSREDGDGQREVLLAFPHVHVEAILLYLVGSDKRQQSLLAQKILKRPQAK